MANIPREGDQKHKHQPGDYRVGGQNNVREEPEGDSKGMASRCSLKKRTERDQYSNRCWVEGRVDRGPSNSDTRQSRPTPKCDGGFQDVVDLIGSVQVEDIRQDTATVPAGWSEYLHT